MNPNKKSNFQRYLSELEVKQAAEKLDVLPESVEKYTFRNTHLFSNVSEFESLFEQKIGEINAVIDDLQAMINLSSQDFEKLPEIKKIRIQAMSGKFRKIQELALDANDCHFLVKLEYENKVRDAFHSLLKVL